MTLSTTMAEALRLTRAGNLAEATRLLSGHVAGASPVADHHRAAPPAFAQGGIIDLVPEQVDVVRARPNPAAEPPGGSFAPHRFAGSTGSIDYWLYVPHKATPDMPLVVMLHGCTQGPEDFARGTGMNRLADEHGFLVAYPAQTQAANAQKCWNWFRPGDQQRDRGEPALIAGLTRAIIAGNGIDPARVYIAGLSAGGAAAAIMAAAYPDIYAAVGVHSGLACGAARDLPSGLMAMKQGPAATSPARPGTFVPVITLHGDRDTTVNAANSQAIVAAALAATGERLTRRSEEGRTPAGRRFTRTTDTDASGRVLIEQWAIHGAGHAWAGGDTSGSYTDPAGPDASRGMIEFFLRHRRC